MISVLRFSNSCGFVDKNGNILSVGDKIKSTANPMFRGKVYEITENELINISHSNVKQNPRDRDWVANHIYKEDW